MTHLDWPFLEPRHGALARSLKARATNHVPHSHGSDVDAYVLDGEKTWISNGGIADFYVVFARSGEAAGSRGISAFIGAAGEGFKIATRTLDVFRTSVAAAVLGFARRALEEALERATRAGRSRAIRALRICEGATEVQQLIIAGELLKQQGA